MSNIDNDLDPSILGDLNFNIQSPSNEKLNKLFSLVNYEYQKNLSPVPVISRGSPTETPIQYNDIKVKRYKVLATFIVPPSNNNNPVTFIPKRIEGFVTSTDLKQMGCNVDFLVASGQIVEDGWSS